ncbi:MAG: hypothetical protein G01um101420_133 [Parcubacteria group bacterium Gr01-1014_20]|nr:MAG: hypothetical protein G01um101420_133 [Parcubacteria group bacterium Gr01-1014_20]
MTWYKSKFEAPDGNETVYEVVTSGDGTGFGIAVADIIQSKPHRHEKMIETYTLVEGMLAVRIDDRVFLLSVEGQSIQIFPGQVHSAWSHYGREHPARVLVFSSPAWTLEDHHLV